MSNNPFCDLVEQPSSLPEMQSDNEHTAKINSEHASLNPPVSAQTHAYSYSFLRLLLRKHTHCLPPNVTHVLTKSKLIPCIAQPLSSTFLTLPFLKMRRKGKIHDSKRHTNTLLNILTCLFNLHGYNYFFLNVSCLAMKVNNRSSHCKFCSHW